MGLFDRIYWPCVCGAKVEIQSKGETPEIGCRMETHPADAVPLVIAADVDNEIWDCEKCGRQYRIRINPPLPQTVAIVAISVVPENPEGPNG